MSAIKIDENLFEAEHRMLSKATADLKSNRYSGNELLPHYQILIEYYHKLLRNTRKIFRISDSQGQLLQQQQSEIQNLLDNANQGFLTFGPDLLVNQKYSAECIRIFGRKIAGLKITQLFGEEAPVDLGEILQQVFWGRPDKLPTLLGKLPSVFRINQRDVRIEWKLINQSFAAGNEVVLMMILTDITDKLRAEEQIRYLSYHDKLTGLHNRAYVEVLLTELDTAAVTPLSLIMADMNALKLVNDVFGHEQGDRILAAMGDALRIACRPTDIISRWGGDEFLVVLPQTAQSDCQAVCERISQACQGMVDIPIPLNAALGSVTQTEGAISLVEMFGVAESRMYNDKLLRSREVRQSIIAKFENMLQSRCFETEGHSGRTYQLTVDFANFLGLHPNAITAKTLNKLAVLHDSGKVAIAKEILGKAGPLSPNEWEIVKSHSEIGYRMAQSIGEPLLADIILALHERWDGHGYPYGLQREQIPFWARLFAIIDVYDLITHDRTYQKAQMPDVALREIESAGGTQFDPELTAKFRQFYDKLLRV